MDPALQELIGEGQPDDDVAIIVRLKPQASVPANLRVVARFGDILTARIERSRIASVYTDSAIASIKAPRLYTPELDEVCSEAANDQVESDERRPSGLTETGKGVCIAVLDWGCDFTHPDFRNADGTTRLHALWDQRAKRDSNDYGYGRVHTRQTIDRALRQNDPLKALGYPIPKAAQHGTHVLGIASGNGLGGGPQGIAPQAEIIFCHLGSSDRNLGNSIELLEALDFAVKQAGDKPLVINMSVGRHAGPHDSSLLVEKAIDWIMVNRPGTAFAQSAGNYYDARCHMEGRLHETLEAELPIEIERRSSADVVVETWYPGADTFIAAVSGPNGISVQTTRGQKADLIDSHGTKLGTLYHRAFDPNNGDHLVDLVLKPEAPVGSWVIKLTGIDVVDGRWHSWIERETANPRAQARFADGAAAVSATTGSICNALRTIAVGAYDAHGAAHPMGKFSSVGPTRDGRLKPLLTAPGVKVLSCRSTAHGGNRYIRMSGTSMAAPHVAGTLALMFEAAGAQPIATIRRALFANLDPVEPDNPRRGYGQLAITRVVEAARAMRTTGSTLHAAVPPTSTTPPEASEASPEFTAPQGTQAMSNAELLSPYFPIHSGGGELLERALDPGDPGVRLIGWGGRRLAEPLAEGDIISNRQGQMLALIAASRLMGHGEAREAGLVTEGPWPGQYVQLLRPDGAPSPFAQRIAAPNGLLLEDVVIMRPTEAEADESEWIETVRPVDPAGRPTIRRGSRGPAVREAQTKLNLAHEHFVATGPGIENCPLAVDGAFGRLTHGAVVSFQQRVFPGEPPEWDGIVGSLTWAQLDRHSVAGGGGTPPGGHTVPPGGHSVPPGGHSAPPGGHSVPPAVTTVEARLRTMLAASLVLASNPAATFTARALPATTALSGSIWEFALSLSGNAVTAGSVTCKVDHGGGHLMAMPVFAGVRWDQVVVGNRGTTSTLPLSADFLLGSFSTTTGGISASHPIWKLPSTLDVGCCAVFAFDLSDPANPAPVAELSRLEPFQAGASGNGWAIVCVEMVCNRPRNDFEPAGVVDVARVYPLVEVLTNFENPDIIGQVGMVRPMRSPMDHGWPNGGRHLVGLYADRNNSLGLMEQVTTFLSGQTGMGIPTWENLFDYVDRDGTSAASSIVIVDPARSGTRTDSQLRRAIDRTNETYSLTTVEKVPRQGDFDNVHIAPPMGVGPLSIGVGPLSATFPATQVSMAPLCAHDCFHMHWRWSKHYTGLGQKGFGSSGPNSVLGAPMVPLNQTVRFLRLSSGPGFIYSARASRQASNQWAVILHHGAGYAVQNRASPGVLIGNLISSFGVPGPVSSAIMTAIGTQEDRMWAWVYYFLQKWPQLQSSPRFDPLDVITFDLPRLRAL